MLRETRVRLTMSFYTSRTNTDAGRWWWWWVISLCLLYLGSLMPYRYQRYVFIVRGYHIYVWFIAFRDCLKSVPIMLVMTVL